MTDVSADVSAPSADEIDAEIEQDLAGHRQRHQQLQAELDAEDVGFASLQHRLFTWLSEQPDVADLDNLGMGIFGFQLAGAGGVSLAINITQ